MVRQRPRKSVEELYATKFEANPIKSQVNSNLSKNIRNNSNNNNNDRDRDRDLSGYIITSNTPYNTSYPAAPSNSTAGPSTSLATSRRKTSARPSSMKPDKFFSKEDKHLNLEDIKKEHSVKSKTSRPEKCAYNSSNLYDNKNYVNFAEGIGSKDMATSHHNYHHHQQHSNHDDDKDDDTEEFFELIRQTVENAIGKSISDLLNRNFRELSAKVDRFSAELKATNSLLNKLQTDMNNKVVHYGEENSRHFRYLCMKSEYDKMFYQHHTMLASNGSPVAAAKAGAVPPKPHMPTECGAEKMSNAAPCTCRSSKALPAEMHKSSSEEQSVSQKSSEIGMREVLEHIQRFCTQMQLNELKCDERVPKGASYRKEDALNMKINKQIFEEDDDDFQMSSDGMTPRSDSEQHVTASHSKYGGTTMRSCSTTRGAGGGGDA